MLKKFYVNNFRSLINLTYEPKEINLFVGNNSTGKSNICKALCFLGLTSRFDISQAASFAVGTQRLSHAYSTSKNTTFELLCEINVNNIPYIFSYSLEISEENKSPFVFQHAVKSEKLTVSFNNKWSVTLLENSFGSTFVIGFNHLNNGHENSMPQSLANQEEKFKPDSTALCQLNFSNEYINAFRSYLQRIMYYDLVPEMIFAPRKHNLEWNLLQDGSNLIPVLYTLKTTDEKLYKEIMLRVKRFDPKISFINFIPSTDVIGSSIQDNQGNSFFLREVSKGTLIYLGICCILATAGRSPLILSREPSIIIIEEPDISIYIGRIKTIMEEIEEISPPIQFIFTSHQPYFIDFFDKRLDSVSAVRMNDNITNIQSIDIIKAERLLDEMALGEQYFQELL